MGPHNPWRAMRPGLIQYNAPIMNYKAVRMIYSLPILRAHAVSVARPGAQAWTCAGRQLVRVP